MELRYNDFLISDDKSLIQIDRVYELLKTTYWAKNRSKEIVDKTIENSLCFGVYKDDVLIGFARVITDYAAVYWLGDVVVDERYRGQEIGKALIDFITKHKQLESLLGLLGTKDASGLYEQFGFKICGDIQMYRLPNNAE
ncbi:MAG: GNAT family N-acetyltransferase [Oscillospiraceae bacterium]|nr:GNAT family N-acetyltransferase [Oscillospiraceae bacterium]